MHYSVRMGGTQCAGSPDYGLDFAGSHTFTDTLVARLVGFYDHEGGYLKRVAVDPTTGVLLSNVDNYGAERSYGGSLALHWSPTERFDATLRAMMQDSNSNGWSAPYAPLPGFAVQSLTMDRTNSVQEGADDRFFLPALQLNYKGDGYSLHESLSYFNRIGTQIEDGSEGTRDALDYYWAFLPAYAGIGALANNYSGNNGLGGSGINEAFPWSETVTYRRTTSETRINFDKNSFGLSGVAGIYLARSFSDTDLNGGNSPLISSLGLNTNAASNAASGTSGGYCRNPSNPLDTSCPTYGSGAVWVSSQPSYHYDEALFGEAYEEFGKFELTVGARGYRQEQSTHEFAAGALNYSYLSLQTPNTRQIGINPKLALKFNIDKDDMIYASTSKGFRAGGAGVPLPLGPQAFFNAIHAAPNTPTTYTSDFVQNYEIGGKFATPDHHYALSAALFQMNWTNIQQTIIAPESYITMIVNAGDAVVRGGEIEADARPVSGVELHAGVGYEDAKITNGALYWQPTGSPVYNTPKVTANASMTFTMPINDATSAFLTLDGSYTGSSYSGTAGCQLNVGPNGLPIDYPAASYPNGFQFFPCPTASPTNYQGYALQRAGFAVLNARVGLDFGLSQLSFYAHKYPRQAAQPGRLQPRVLCQAQHGSGAVRPGLRCWLYRPARRHAAPVEHRAHLAPALSGASGAGAQP